MSEKVLIYSRFPKALMARIRERFELLDTVGKPPAEIFTADRLSEIRALVTAGGTPLKADAMEALPSLRAIICYGTGYDGVDLAAVDPYLLRLPELVDDVGRRDRAEERAGRAGLDLEAEYRLLEGRGCRKRRDGDGDGRAHCCCASGKSTFTNLMAAGPMVTTQIAGKMQKTSGNTILTPVFAAASSIARPAPKSRRGARSPLARR